MLAEDEIAELYDQSSRTTIDTFLDPLRRGQGYLRTAVRPKKAKRFSVDLIPGDPRLALSEDLLASDWVADSCGLTSAVLAGALGPRASLAALSAVKFAVVGPNGIVAETAI